MSTFKTTKKMKRFYDNFAAKIAAVALMAAAVSCSSEDDMTPPLTSADGESAIRISLTASTEGTRTTFNATDLMKWNANDAAKVGLLARYEYETRDYPYGEWSTSGGHKVYQSTGVNLGNNPRTALFSFEANNTESDYSRNYKIAEIERAIYPFPGEYATSVVTFTVSGEQTQSAAGETTYGAASVPMVGIPSEHQASDDRKSISCLAPMHVLSSIIAFYVYDSSQNYADEAVQSIEFQSDGDNIAGDTKIFWSSVAEGELPELTGSGTTVKTSLETAFAMDGVAEKSQSSPIYMSVVPGSFTGKIMVETDKAIYSYTVSSPKTFDRANIKVMSLNLSSDKASRMDKSAYVAPEVRYIKLVRSSTTTTTVTIERVNEEAVGFYIHGKFTNSTTERITKDEVLSGSVYRFGAEDNDSDLFTLQDDGTVVYKVPKVGYSSSAVTWGVVAFDKFGLTGDFTYEYGYGISSVKDDVTSGFEYNH